MYTFKSIILIPSPHRTSGLSGTVNVNRKDSCYITQTDVHQPFLTIGEMMRLACQLKPPATAHTADTDQIITSILKNLHLNHRRDVMAKRLSGGEKKRLSIAIELVADPSIFFLDEPTSGLDEVTAFQCIRLLRDLAQQDRTVVCTIHQPSAAIFKLVDSLYVISQGLCVYQGAPGALVPFLTTLNLQCPVHYNPADYSKLEGSFHVKQATIKQKCHHGSGFSKLIFFVDSATNSEKKSHVTFFSETLLFGIHEKHKI
jgi:ABC-type multidrug transport system ATPase subunit